MIYTNKLISLANGRTLDASTGKVYSSENLAKYIQQNSTSVAEKQANIVIKEKVDVVVGLDEQKIDLRLVTNQLYPTEKGFLIEVYESGSDGKLFRVYEESVVDEIEEKVVSEGFSRYFTIEVE